MKKGWKVKIIFSVCGKSLFCKQDGRKDFEYPCLALTQLCRFIKNTYLPSRKLFKEGTCATCTVGVV